MVISIAVDTTKRLAPVAPEIYGGLIEHLGRNVYGGVYGPADPTADTDGFRQDVLEAVRELDMPVSRYPGGCFTDTWHWEEGIGDRAKRPARLDFAWRQPTAYRPSTNKVNELVRQDFCGWSALGPIALMIENVVGLVRMDAAEQRIEWLPGGSGRMGMKNLPLGGNRISLVLENDRISVDCIQPFRLIFRGRELACPAGRSVIEILLG